MSDSLTSSQAGIILATPHTEFHMITFDTDPSRYRHWHLACAGPIATLTLDVAEEGGLSPGYRLKLNS